MMGNVARYWRLDAALCLAVAALSAWALARHPYSYYTFLRWIVCASAIYMIWRLYASEMASFAVPFGIIALLFNPVIPIHLSRHIWEPLNVVCTIAFVGAVYLTGRPKPL